MTLPQTDIPGSLTPEDCMDELSLSKIKDKPWHMTASNALTGAGIIEGMYFCHFFESIADSILYLNS